MEYSEALSIYMKEIGKYPNLPQHELNDLIIKAQNGDLKARDKVALSNLRFVVKVANTFTHRGLPLEDLISEGQIGLLHAIDLFDPSRGVPFLGYATWWIKQAIGQAIFWNSRDIRLPVSQHIKIMAILHGRQQFEQEHGRTPTTVELAEIIDLPTSQIDFLAQYLIPTLSVDSYIHGDEENSQLCEVIPDDDLKPLEDIVDDKIITDKLLQVLSTLSPREHDVIVMTFGIGMQPVPNKQIASMFGVCTERIRQIKQEALHRMGTVHAKYLKSLR